MSIEIINHSLIDDANLKFYARFESGALTTDSSGEGHTLTAISDPAEDASGKFGGAVALDGNDAYSAADHADFKPTGNFTVGVWVKDPGQGAQNGLFQSFSQNTNLAGFQIKINTDGKITVVSGKNTGTTDGVDYKAFNSSGNVAGGAWHFVVLVWDGTYLRLYIDGAEDASSPVSWANAPAYAATNYVRIGSRNSAGSDGSFFTGSLDDVFLINGTALSAAQILNIYQNYAMACAVGTFTLTGIDTILTKSLHLIAETGSFILTGISATLSRGYTLVASVGEFTLTGIDVIFSKGYNIVCSVGEFTLTGMVVALKKLSLKAIWTSVSRISSNWTKPSKNNTNWTKPE